MQLELRRHPANWYDINRITGLKRGPLEPDDPAYPEAFRPQRAIYCDGVHVAYVNLSDGGNISFIPNRVLPKPSEAEKETIRQFVQSQMADGHKVGDVLNVPLAVPADDIDEDDEEEDDDE